MKIYRVEFRDGRRTYARAKDVEAAKRRASATQGRPVSDITIVVEVTGRVGVFA